MLKKGDKAPGFIGKNQDGKDVRLSDYEGKKLVLYFYPKNNAPSCTAQACNLRDNYGDFLKKGYEIVGISKDTQKSHQNFIRKYQLPFTLISDADTVIQQKYGVWREKAMFGQKYMGAVRTTFVIEEQGMIGEVITKVNAKQHAMQILK